MPGDRDVQILRSSHDSELDCPLVTKLLVRPLADGSNLFDGGDTVVGDEDLCDDGVTALRTNKVRDYRGRGVVDGVATWRKGMRQRDQEEKKGITSVYVSYWQES